MGKESQEAERPSHVGPRAGSVPGLVLLPVREAWESVSCGCELAESPVASPRNLAPYSQE